MSGKDLSIKFPVDFTKEDRDLLKKVLESGEEPVFKRPTLYNIAFNYYIKGIPFKKIAIHAGAPTKTILYYAYKDKWYDRKLEIDRRAQLTSIETVAQAKGTAVETLTTLVNTLGTKINEAIEAGEVVSKEILERYESAYKMLGDLTSTKRERESDNTTVQSVSDIIKQSGLMISKLNETLKNTEASKIKPEDEEYNKLHPKDKRKPFIESARKKIRDVVITDENAGDILRSIAGAMLREDKIKYLKEQAEKEIRLKELEERNKKKEAKKKKKKDNKKKRKVLSVDDIPWGRG